MAGSQLDRLKNQAQIFLTVKLDPKTPQGKNRLIVIGICIFLALFVITQSGGDASTRSVRRSQYTISDDSNVFEDTDDEGDVDGNLVEDNEGDEDEDDDGGGRGGGDDEDEEEEEEDEDDGGRGHHRRGGSDDEEDMESLKGEQQERLRGKGAEILKFFESYRKESDIYKHFTLLSDTYQSLDIIKTKIIGQTYEKRDIRVYQLGKGATHRSMLVIGLEHGSEWPASMALTYFATRMVQLYGVNNDVTDLMKSLTIYLIPVANPDGFSYSMSSKHYRHWQYNKAKTKKGKGVDLNRDWENMSQLETQAIRDFIKSHPIQGFVSVHCCSGNVIKPLARQCANSNALSYQNEVAKEMIQAMSDSGYQYVLKDQSPPSKKTKASGFAVNWFNEEMNVKLAYTLEGRGALAQMKKKKPSEKKLVDVPVSELVTVSREVTKGILSLGTHIARDYDGSDDGCAGGVGMSAGKNSVDDEDAGDEDAGDADDEDAGDADDEDAGDADDDDAGDADDDDVGDSEADTDAADEDAEDEDEGETEIEAESTDDDGGEVEGDTINDDDDDENMNEDKETIADTYDESKEVAKPIRKELKLETALSHAEKQARSAYIPSLSANELPPADGSGPYFLYFAYSADMLFDLLITSGIQSAWKVVNARLANYGFDYTYYSKSTWKSGIADALKHKHSYVWGVVYRVSKSERDILDHHNMAAGPASYIIPMNVTVYDKLGNSYQCRAYRVRSKMSGTEVFGKYRRFSPSRQYRNCVIKGAKQQRLPREYIDKLRSIAPLFSDKIGNTKHRNPNIGTICDKEKHR